MDNFNLPAKADLENTLDESKDDEARMLKRVIENQNACAALGMALVNETAARCLERTETSDWPDGVAKTAIKNLEEKYLPRTVVGRTALRTQLSELEMEESHDPSELFEKLYNIKSVWDSSCDSELA